MSAIQIKNPKFNHISNKQKKQLMEKYDSLDTETKNICRLQDFSVALTTSRHTFQYWDGRLDPAKTTRTNINLVDLLSSEKYSLVKSSQLVD